jgi:hypothetical protein
LLECEEAFDDLSLKGKMIRVIRKSENDLQDIFYEMGVKGDLPPDYESFKDFIVKYCMEDSIYTVKKFREETWAQ